MIAKILWAGMLAILCGCQSVPHAPVVYTSKWSVGLVAEQASAAPVPTVNFGVQIDDGAWVPAISCQRLTKDGKADGACTARIVYAKEDLPGPGNDRVDAFSVFGTFNTAPSVTPAKAAEGQTAATPLGAALTAGKIFSTGVAADQLAAAGGPKLLAACIASIGKNMKPSDTLDRLNKALAICGVPAYKKPTTQ